MNTATQQRDAGMAQALGHAESVEPGWADDAYLHMEVFCCSREDLKFTSNQFISWHRDDMGASQPPTPKAFGSIFTKAARNGLIRKVGYRPHPLRHASPTVLWEVV